jgi:hypothetical protein
VGVTDASDLDALTQAVGGQAPLFVADATTGPGPVLAALEAADRLAGGVVAT